MDKVSASRERVNRFHSKNPGKRTEYSKRWRAKYPEKAKALGREQQRRRQLRYGTEKRRLIAYKSLLKRKYGITLADYERMLVEQKGGCAVCSGITPYGRGDRWHVDHDHKTGKVRGLLCSRCNTALGLMQDSVTVAESAAQYLRKHRS